MTGSSLHGPQVTEHPQLKSLYQLHFGKDHQKYPDTAWMPLRWLVNSCLSNHKNLFDNRQFLIFCNENLSQTRYGTAWRKSHWTLDVWHVVSSINPLNAKLNPISYLLALLGAHHILHVCELRVKRPLCHSLYAKKAPDKADCYLKGKMIFLVIKRAICKIFAKIKKKYLVYMKAFDQYAVWCLGNTDKNSHSWQNPNKLRNRHE